MWYKSPDLLSVGRSASEAAQLELCRGHVSSLQAEMSGKFSLAFTLMATLLASGAASSPESSAAGESRALRKLLVKRARESPGRLEPAPRTERRAHLSENEREIMTKQITQAISEAMNSECLLSRDYQGWVDFGRRDAE